MTGLMELGTLTMVLQHPQVLCHLLLGIMISFLPLSFSILIREVVAELQLSIAMLGELKSKVQT
jgi:hypothetical protein